MGKPQIVIIHGAMTSGKSTITENLTKKLKDYIFVDRAYVKDVMLKKIKKRDRQFAKELSKETIFFIVRNLMPHKYNIILQEMRAPSFKVELQESIKKYNYEIKSFYLHCSLKTAQKRNLSRGKSPVDPEMINEMYKKHSYPDTEDFIIDTDKNSIGKSLSIILKEIKS